MKLKDEFSPRVGLIIRLFWVFSTAPFVGSLSWILMISLLLRLSPFDAGGFIGLLIVTALYSYPATFLIGIPSYLVYRRLQIYSLRNYIVGGFVGGVIVGIFIFGILPDSGSYVLSLIFSLVSWFTIGIAAVIETYYFWALVIRSRLSVS